MVHVRHLNHDCYLMEREYSAYSHTIATVNLMRRLAVIILAFYPPILVVLFCLFAHCMSFTCGFGRLWFEMHPGGPKIISIHKGPGSIHISWDVENRNCPITDYFHLSRRDPKNGTTEIHVGWFWLFAMAMTLPSVLIYRALKRKMHVDDYQPAFRPEMKQGQPAGRPWK